MTGVALSMRDSIEDEDGAASSLDWSAARFATRTL